MSNQRKVGAFFSLKGRENVDVHVFSTKVLIADTIFTHSNGDGTAILRGHPSHTKV